MMGPFLTITASSKTLSYFMSSTSQWIQYEGTDTPNIRGARNEEMFQKLLLSGVPSEQFPWICLKYQA